ncbi:MAG: site-2 protease family protein [Chloroflexi bacterium]|nr:site-2 protease family protein [Chloroflexota bacterium]
MLYQILSGQMSPTEIAALIIALVLGITVHEFSHAAAATWLGDSLPGRQGRLTLAPAAHLDVMGSLMFLVGGFGWGKPVQYNPYALRAGPRTGPALVALAGPLSNFVLAALFAIPVRLLLILSSTTTRGLFSSNGPESIAFQLLVGIVSYNLILGVFNMIPIFPLDGFSILLGVLPAEFAYRFEQTRQWGFFLLIALLLLQGYVPLIGDVLFGPVIVIRRLLTGL